MKKTVIIVLTACLVLSLIFFIRATDWGSVLNLTGKIGYKFLILLLVTCIAYVMGTLSWQFTLGKHFGTLSTLRLFLVRHLGETVGMFNPGSVIGGDVFKAIILERYGIPKKTALWSIFLSRAILVISQVSVFITVVIGLLVQKPDVFGTGVQQSGMVPFLLNHWKTFRSKCRNTLVELPEILRENKKMLAFSSLFAILHWIFGALEFYYILTFLGLKISLLQALLVDLGVVLFKSAGAFIPAQIGVEEYGNKFMLMVIGISAPQVWISASLLRRARQLFWIAFGVAIYFILFKKSRYLVPHKNGNTVR